MVTEGVGSHTLDADHHSRHGTHSKHTRHSGRAVLSREVHDVCLHLVRENALANGINVATNALRHCAYIPRRGVGWCDRVWAKSAVGQCPIRAGRRTVHSHDRPEYDDKSEMHHVRQVGVWHGHTAARQPHPRRWRRRICIAAAHCGHSRHRHVHSRDHTHAHAPTHTACNWKHSRMAPDNHVRRCAIQRCKRVRNKPQQVNNKLSSSSKQPS